MATLNSVQCLYFSPTGGTRTIVETVAKGMSIPIADPIDITTPQQRKSWTGQIAGDLLIVGVPVYTGTFPTLILQPLGQLHGSGRWALPVAVCGNVRMGTCLAEICAILKKQGFGIPAAGNFIAQHSFYCEEFPVGEDRPDDEDLQKAAEFGRQVAAIVGSNPSDVTSLYRGNLYIRMYVSGSVEATGRSSLGEKLRSTIKVSDYNSEICENCNRCVESCPTGSIDPVSLEIEDESCLRCFACTYACPSGVRQKVVHPAEHLASWFKQRTSERGEPLLFF